MKVLVISDTHGDHRSLKKLPEADLVIHAGDVSLVGDKEEVDDFLEWYHQLNYEYKILIAGNHDRYLEYIASDKERSKQFKDALDKIGIIYLNDSGCHLNGAFIWGSPVQPTYKTWAFNRDRGEAIKWHWNLIPNGVDILITHGPSFGNMDKIDQGENVGCKDLLTSIKRVKPRFHIFGHVHESYGVKENVKLGTTFINAAVADKKKKVKKEPILFEIDTTKSTAPLHPLP